MVKQFCDICGEEIESSNEGSMFKLKKREYSFTESWWERPQLVLGVPLPEDQGGAGWTD